MKMKSIIITALVIGVFFTGQAFAAHNVIEDNSTSYGFRDGAAEGQRGVPEQESRPDPYSAGFASPDTDSWRFGAAVGQNGVPEQNFRAWSNGSQYADNQDTNADQPQAYFGSEQPLRQHDFETIEDSQRPPDGG
jgi:hypothetical protein